MFKLVERGNQNAVHGLFDTLERAQYHHYNRIPEYCRKGFFDDKSLRPCDFEIIEAISDEA